MKMRASGSGQRTSIHAVTFRTNRPLAYYCECGQTVTFKNMCARCAGEERMKSKS
jgi:hypothetical protein